jgi:CO/xanthine dehydrogenase FAD-binding subunit
MINHYYRPKTLKEALSLLKKPNSIPLSGCTFITPKTGERISVIDLQELGLDSIIQQGEFIKIGSTTKLTMLYQSNLFPEMFKKAINLEAPLNLRNMISLGGLLATCDGRSSLTTSLLALDAKFILEPGHESLSISDLLIFRSRAINNSLLTEIQISSRSNFNFEYVARTPTDRPIVCAAMAQWDNGRTRLALGGFGTKPLLVMDGLASDDFISASRITYSHAGDGWATAEYRSEIAAILTKRCLETKSESIQ